MAAATMAQEFEETRGFARRQHHWKGHSASQHHLSSSRDSNELGYRQQSSHGEQHGGGYSSRNYSNSGGYSGSSNNSSYSGSSSTGNNSTRASSQGNTSKNSYPSVQSSRSQASGQRVARSEKPGHGVKRPVTCFGCGEPGHIRPNCPNRVRRVRSLGRSLSCLLMAA